MKFAELFSLKEKVAIVTGGAGLLGQKFSTGLAEFGSNVAILDLNLNKSNEIANELQFKYGIKAKGYECDVSNPDSIKTVVSEIVVEFGKIDILINNAAAKTENLDEFFASVENYDIEQWKKVMSINIDGMFLMAQAVGKQMVAQAYGGSIVQTSSIYGILGPDQNIYEGSQYLNRQINTPAVYSASKAAVIGLSRYLATYWAKNKIRVNTIIPGGVESGQNSEFVKKYSARVPMGRMANPDEIVGAVIFLSSEASSYITGQNIIIDGGLESW